MLIVLNSILNVFTATCIYSNMYNLLHVILILFYHCLYGGMFCTLLLNSVSYVFLLLYLCILIVMYALFRIFCSHLANWHSSATLTEVFCAFFSVVRQVPVHNSQRWGTALTLPN
jgi:hypothetical protein